MKEEKMWLKTRLVRFLGQYFYWWEQKRWEWIDRQYGPGQIAYYLAEQSGWWVPRTNNEKFLGIEYVDGGWRKVI